ncbi:Bifunctional protein Aas [subsurface metagenome]
MAAGKAHRIFITTIVILWVIVSTPVCTVFILLFRPFSLLIPAAFARLWCSILTLMSGITVTVEGLSKLDRKKSYIFASNHLSAADIALLYYGLPFRIGYLAKKELFFIPFFGWSMWALGHVAVDRKNPQRSRRSIERAAKILHKGRTSLVVFPEGTRSVTGELGVFKLGVFSLAIKAGVEIVPVAIQGTRELMPKGSFYINPCPVSIRVDSSIPTASLTRKNKQEIATRVRARVTAMLAAETWS